MLEMQECFKVCPQQKSDRECDCDEMRSYINANRNKQKSVGLKPLTGSKRISETGQYSFDSVLVVGLGSAGCSTLALLEGRARRLLCVTQNSKAGRKKLLQLDESNGLIKIKGRLKVDVLIDEMYLGFSKLRGVKKAPDIIFLCCPNHQYLNVLQKLFETGVLIAGQAIVAISYRLGCGLEITRSIDKLFENDENNSKVTAQDFTIVNFSMYYAVAKRVEKDCYTQYYMPEIKKQIYIGVSNSKQDKVIKLITDMLGTINVDVKIADNLLHAEIYNINIYIHAQLLILDNILQEIFTVSENDGFCQYMYNLEEYNGIVSAKNCEQIIKAEAEIINIYKRLNLKPVSYVELEYYSYHHEQVNEEMVKNYSSLDMSSKVAMLKTILVHDNFKNIKLERIHMEKTENGESICIVPRLPKEDYISIVVLSEVSKLIGLNSPTIDKMRDCFETFIRQYKVKTNVDFEEIFQNAKGLANYIVKVSI